MKTETLVEVTVTEEPTKFTGDIRNYTVVEHPYDLGGIVGNGATLEEAVEDFKEWYSLKRDMECEVKIINK